MPRGMDEWLAILGAWAAAGLVLSWSHWPARARAAAAVLMSALGLAFIVIALQSEGVDEAASRAVYIAGPSYITDQASAAASQKYYVLAGICLLLGTTGLAVSEAGALWLRRHPTTVAIAYSLTITGLRFVLERAAAPQPLAYAVGITWLVPVIGTFLALSLSRLGNPGPLPLLRALAVYGLVTRATVAALVALATRLKLGSHYDISALTRVRSFFDGHEYSFEAASWRQIAELGVIPQVIIWPIFTVVVGGVAGAVVLALLPRRDHDGAPGPGAAEPLERDPSVPEPPVTGA